jgi:thioredoxin-like negative regulator of GroEL
MQRPWISRSGLAVGLLGLGLGASWTVAAWRFQAGLRVARAEIAAGRFEAARRWLAAQSPGRPEHAEAAYLLGVCERALGDPEAAAAAMARVPTECAFGDAAALVRVRTLIDDLGRYSEAEAVLGAVTARSRRSPDAAQLRYAFTQLLYWQGRLDEMRRLLQEGWDRSLDRAGDLYDLWLIDNAALTLEQVRASVDRAARAAPDDDRVWLARANLTLHAGRFEEAARWLDDCLRRRPEDPAVWRLRLRWAQATDRVEEARRCLRHLPADRFTTTEVLSLRAWFAAHRGLLEAERIALEELVAQVPGHTQALERLAALSANSGQAGRAAELRRRKAQADRVKERYYRLLESPQRLARSAELGGLAEELGRGFEARAWWQLAARQRPGDSAAAAAVARLGPPRSDSPPPVGPTPLARWFDTGAGPSPRDGSIPTPGPDPVPAVAAVAGAVPVFRDEAGPAGLRFAFRNGRSTLRQLPETTSGGVGLLDYDGDGWLDVYVVQGGVFPPEGTAVPAETPRRPEATATDGDRLFRNRGDGTFEDVSRPSGIARLARGYGHGVSVGDVDNDGRPDLFLTRWRSYALYRNRGDGTFEDVTERAGLGGDRDWPTSAAFADLDNDGDLDLYVCHYLVWDAAHPSLCLRPAKPGEESDPDRRYEYCMPNPFPARPDHLFRNDGGRFVDVTAEAGIVDRDGRGLGVVATDVDDDGRVDLFVANDTTANYLFRNLGGLHFEELATAAGVACSAAGAYQAGMGTAAGDLDGDGRPDLLVTNFYGESTTFFQNLGGGSFADRTAAIGLAAPSRYLLGFGIILLDANNDGRLDLAQTNGHVIDNRPNLFLDMPGLLLIGGAEGRLVDVTEAAGAAWTTPRIGRGLAVGDLDNDGRIDLVAVPQNSPLVYFRNRTPGGHSVTFLLEGTRSNRDAVGAMVTLTAGARRRRAWRLGGGSYQSASDPRIHFGLEVDRIEQVEVRWPSGRVDRFGSLEVDCAYRLREGAASPALVRRFARR